MKMLKDLLAVITLGPLCLFVLVFGAVMEFVVWFFTVFFLVTGACLIALTPFLIVGYLVELTTGIPVITFIK